jgi:glutaredoxin
MLRLYDIENCPYCRLVREVLTELNLDCEIRPCPKGGKRFRPELLELAGRAQFPYLIDESQGVAMYESMDIVRHLYTSYSDVELPLKWRLGGLQTLSSSLASGLRITRGMSMLPSELPARQLELYSFEASPFARPVRELLCQLELPYVLRSSGRSELAEWLPPAVRDRLGIEPGSELANRIALQEREGRTGIPFLFDPNTDTGLFESDVIIDYLVANYAK